MAQLSSAVDNHGQGITRLSSLVFMKLLCNGLLQVPMQLVASPNALMHVERGEVGQEA